MKSKISFNPKRCPWTNGGVLFSLSNERCFQHSFWIKSGGILGMQQFYWRWLCVVAFDLLTPASVSSLWNSSKLLNQLFFFFFGNSVTCAVWAPFLSTLFPSRQFCINVLWYKTLLTTKLFKKFQMRTSSIIKVNLCRAALLKIYQWTCWLESS